MKLVVLILMACLLAGCAYVCFSQPKDYDMCAVHLYPQPKATDSPTVETMTATLTPTATCHQEMSRGCPDCCPPEATPSAAARITKITVTTRNGCVETFKLPYPLADRISLSGGKCP